jgi:hypothetical protein
MLLGCAPRTESIENLRYIFVPPVPNAPPVVAGVTFPPTFVYLNTFSRPIFQCDLLPNIGQNRERNYFASKYFAISIPLSILCSAKYGPILILLLIFGRQYTLHFVQMAKFYYSFLDVLIAFFHHFWLPHFLIIFLDIEHYFRFPYHPFPISSPIRTKSSKNPPFIFLFPFYWPKC